MDKFNDLIVYLMAIKNNAKDIHYTCYGDDFYGKHLFADRIAENLSDYIDQIKETCILGHDNKVLNSSEYLARASKCVYKEPTFSTLDELILNCLELIESFDEISRGDSKLLDDIANTLQNHRGLLKIMFGDKK